MSVKYFKQASKMGLRKRMAFAFAKKLLGIKSKSLMNLGITDYEYDHMGEGKKYFDDLIKTMNKYGGEC